MCVEEEKRRSTPVVRVLSRSQPSAGFRGHGGADSAATRLE